MDSMNKVLLFGGTGHVGKKVAETLKLKGFHVTAVVRSQQKGELIGRYIDSFIIAEVTAPGQLKNICNGFDIVISALGKSVSPNDRSKASFREIDLHANEAILKEAIASNVRKFVYVSAFHAEKLQHLEYFKAHHEFSQVLKTSGLDYSIIKPPAIFSSFIDLMDMAKKGRLMTMGTGEKTTNPIYEGDLARIIVDSIHQHNVEIEAGGKSVYSRRQINEIIQTKICPDKKVHSIPVGLMKISLPLMRLVDKNAFDKFAFFLEVMQDDLLAPRMGSTTLEEYVDRFA